MRFINFYRILMPQTAKKGEIFTELIKKKKL